MIKKLYMLTTCETVRLFAVGVPVHFVLYVHSQVAHYLAAKPPHVHSSQIKCVKR